VRREVVLRRANWAHPVFEPEINLTVRVQYCLALLAGDWLILDKGHAFNVFEWGVNRTNRNDNPCLCELVARPIVPREPEAILELSLIEVHLNFKLDYTY
jgi:hypothetical protein